MKNKAGLQSSIYEAPVSVWVCTNAHTGNLIGIFSEEEMLKEDLNSVNRQWTLRKFTVGELLKGNMTYM